MIQHLTPVDYNKFGDDPGIIMFDSSEELLRKIQLGGDAVLEIKTVNFRGNKIHNLT